MSYSLRLHRAALKSYPWPTTSIIFVAKGLQKLYFILNLSISYSYTYPSAENQDKTRAYTKNHIAIIKKKIYFKNL